MLATITFAAYWQALGCKFIECYDDEDYVTDNVFITRGFTAETVRWAFTTFRCTNWHPLTWLSHMADYRLHGLDPRGHHLTNLLLHIANTLVLFLVLSRMTGAVWRSGFVAALFAVHPLHVESVAWVAERKDVLSTLLLFLTISAYVWYSRRPSLPRYLLIVLFFGLGLLAKPMLVSLPIALLLLDYWPLQRLGLKWRLVWEKIPLLLMSAGACAMTIVAQKSGGAVVGMGDLPLRFRLGNALVAYVRYLMKMFWPDNLSTIYPHPGADLPVWQPALAFATLAVMSFLFLRSRGPYLVVGWLWYLITLLPVIGLMQVGAQAMADRYTYITLLGPFIMVAWGVPDLLGRLRPSLSRLLPVLGAAIICALAVCTWLQVRVWQDTDTLFSHAIRVTRGNAAAYCNRGVWLFRQGNHEEAVAALSKALELDPTYTEQRYDLALALLAAGKHTEAAAQLLRCLEDGFDTPGVHHNLALAYYNLGNLDLAASECQAALEMQPESPAAHSLFGAVLFAQRSVDAAISEWQIAAQLAPDFAEPHNNLARAYVTKRDYRAAWEAVRRFEALGGQADPRFLADLAKHMPNPTPPPQPPMEDNDPR